MKRTLAALAALLPIVAGCASAPTPTDAKLVTQTVEVPVAVACKPTLSPAPAYPDTDAALKGAPDIFSGVKLLMAGRALRIAREGELNAALDGCAKP